MEVKHVVGGLVAIALLAWFAHGLRDPLRTALPFGTTDLSSVQVQLRRLSPADRALVEAYVRRSHGDVLPAKFADPDQPFTARTLGEAIALEKAWDVRRDAKDAEAARRQAERDAAMAPLRDAVEAGCWPHSVWFGGGGAPAPRCSHEATCTRRGIRRRRPRPHRRANRRPSSS
jgi:hypothetical protein